MAIGRGSKVRFIGHPDHVAPPILELTEGLATGSVIAELEDGLVRVKITGLNFPWVQLHVDQLEPS